MGRQAHGPQLSEPPFSLSRMFNLFRPKDCLRSSSAPCRAGSLTLMRLNTPQATLPPAPAGLDLVIVENAGRGKGGSQSWAPWACLSMGQHGLRKDRRSGTPRLAASRRPPLPYAPDICIAVIHGRCPGSRFCRPALRAARQNLAPPRSNRPMLGRCAASQKPLASRASDISEAAMYGRSSATRY